MSEEYPSHSIWNIKQLDQYTDEELLGQMKNMSSDESGVIFAEIYQRYHDRILHYLFGFVHDYQIAEDLLQEIMVKLFNNYQSFRITEKFSSWFYRISSNTAITYLKKMKKRESIAGQIEFDALEIDILDDRLTSLEDQLERKELAEYLDKLILQVPVKFRMVFLLRLQEEKSYQEISAILEISERTAKWRMNKGIELMKKILLSQKE